VGLTGVRGVVYTVSMAGKVEGSGCTCPAGTYNPGNVHEPYCDLSHPESTGASLLFHFRPHVVLRVLTSAEKGLLAALTFMPYASDLEDGPLRDELNQGDRMVTDALNTVRELMTEARRVILEEAIR
jgi:hypothetical protein